MEWFGRLKQLNTANQNINIAKASETELEDLITELPLIDRIPLKIFRDTLFNNLLADCLFAARKCYKKKHIDIAYTAAAACLAAVEAGMNVCHILQERNPPAGILLKRHIKDKIAKW